MTTPLTTILDRDEPVRNVSVHFSVQLKVLRDIVNYGSNLIPRCFEASPKGAVDTVIIAVLLKHTVAMLDGVELHVSNAAVLASHVSMRALYEAHLYFPGFSAQPRRLVLATITFGPLGRDENGTIASSPAR